MQENDVRPPLEVEAPAPEPQAKTAVEEAKEQFGIACGQIGVLYYEIDTLKGSMGEAVVRARNANHAYHKLKVAETRQHLAEATVTPKE